jgi:hypothetical protein
METPGQSPTSVLLAAAVIALAASCSSSEAAPASSAGGSAGVDSGAGGSVATGGGDAGGAAGASGSDGAVPDAADASADHAEIPVLDCLGESLTLTLSKGLPYASAKLGDPAASGQYLLDLATTSSSVDLAQLGPPVPLASGCDPTALGQLCQFASFDFFGPWGGVSLFTASYAGVKGSVEQAGIIGTDFWSVAAFSLDYAHSLVHHAKTEAELCTPAALDAAGLAPLSSAGFFSKDLSTLKPLSEVVASAPTGLSVPNVPTVPLRISGVTALAQLDTGFDDSLTPFSVNVNQPFLDAVEAAAPGALVRNAAKDLTLTTCAGVNESVLAYDLAGGTAVELVAESGAVARSYSMATVFLKKPSAATAVCGGIGTWTAPAAQIGAAFFADAGTVVFDPFVSRVWWPRG